MLKQRWFISGLVAVGVIVATGLAQIDRPAAKPKARALFTKDGAYLVLPPKVLDSDGINSCAWTGDGKHLVYVRTNPARPLIGIEDAIASIMGQGPSDSVGASIECFDVSSGRSRVLWQDPSVMIQPIVPVGKGSSFFASVDVLVPGPAGGRPTMTHSLLSVDAESGKWRFVPELQGRSEYIKLEPNPVRPVAMVWLEKMDEFEVMAPAVDAAADAVAVSAGAAQEPTASAAKVEAESMLLDSQGRVIKRYADVPAGFASWSLDGNQFFWVRHSRKATIAYGFGDAGKAMKLDATPPAWEPPNVTPPLQAFIVAFSAPDRNRFGSLHGLYLHALAKKGKDLLLAPGGGSPLMAPGLNAIAYTVDRQVKVAQILKMPPEYAAKLKAAIRQEALSNAKQAGLAILMYSNDFDDAMPLSAGFNDIVNPYLKNESVLADFNYTPPGNLLMTAIESPATTVIGYIEGPDGRAVVYADGHAKWLSDPDDGP
jgi:hypothetical protein